MRYCGYANELGEAFAAWLPPGGVPLSYAAAILYVVADTYDKTTLAYGKAGRQLGRSSLDTRLTPSLQRLVAGGIAIDTLVWQLCASVAIPGFTIHMVVHYVHEALLAAALRADALHAALTGPPESPVEQALETLHVTMADPGTRELAFKMLPTLLGEAGWLRGLHAPPDTGFMLIQAVHVHANTAVVALFCEPP